jgi:hypothetical protein
MLPYEEKVKKLRKLSIADLYALNNLFCVESNKTTFGLSKGDVSLVDNVLGEKINALFNQIT